MHTVRFFRLKVLLRFFVLGGFSISFAFAAPAFDSSKIYSTEELGKNFSAIHITSVLPRNGIIQGKKGIYRNSVRQRVYRELNLPVGGSYWTLGQAIPDHPGAFFGDKRYGIVLPFAQLYPSLLNISPRDIFILGDLDLKEKEEVALFIPKSEMNAYANENFGKTKLVFYEGDLRENITAYLENENKTWLVDFNFSTGASFSYHDRITVRGETKNINTLDFFQSVLTEFAHVSFGLETVSFTGGPLSGLRYLRDFEREVKAFTSEGVTSLDVVRYRLEPRLLLAEKIERDLLERFSNPNHPLAPSASRLLDQLESSRKYLRVARIDLEFRKRFGFLAVDIHKYLKGAGKWEVNGIFITEEKDELAALLDSFRGDYPSNLGGGIQGEKTLDNLTIISTYLINCPWSFVENYLAHPYFEKKRALWETLYWLNRWIRRDYGARYADSISHETEFDKFTEAYQKVQEYVLVQGIDVDVCLFLDALVKPLDLSITDPNTLSNRVRALSVMKDLITRVPEFQIEFADEIRTWSIRESLVEGTGGDSSPLNSWTWATLLTRLHVNGKSPFLR